MSKEEPLKRSSEGWLTVQACFFELRWIGLWVQRVYPLRHSGFCFQNKARKEVSMIRFIGDCAGGEVLASSRVLSWYSTIPPSKTKPILSISKEWANCDAEYNFGNSAALLEGLWFCAPSFRIVCLCRWYPSWALENYQRSGSLPAVSNYLIAHFYYSKWWTFVKLWAIENDRWALGQFPWVLRQKTSERRFRGFSATILIHFERWYFENNRYLVVKTSPFIPAP